MLIYILIFSICIILQWVYSRKTGNNNTACIYLIIFTLSLFAGLRDIGVGTDTAVYPESYFKAASNHSSFFSNLFSEDSEFNCKPYFVLSYIASLLSSNIWASFFLTHLFIVAILIWGILKYSPENKKNLPIFMFLYLFLFYNQSLNYMRQACAVSCVFAAFPFFLKRKWVPYIILQILAYMFHSSAFISLILPLVVELSSIKNNTKRNLLLAGSIVSLLILVNSFYYVLSFASSSGIINEVYESRYGENSQYDSIGNFPKTDIVISCAIYLFIYLSYKKKILQKSTNTFVFAIHTFCILIFMLSTYVVYLHRLTFYFYILVLWYSSIILSSNKIPQIIKLSFYAFVLFAWYYTYILKGSCETYPYTSKILGID